MPIVKNISEDIEIVSLIFLPLNNNKIEKNVATIIALITAQKESFRRFELIGKIVELSSKHIKI